MELVLAVFFVFFVLLALPDFILFFSLKAYQTRQVTPESSDSLLSQSFRRSPRIYLSSKLPIEALGLPSLFGDNILVSESLWQSWHSDEKEACLFWLSAARSRYSAYRSLFGGRLQIFILDRDSLLLGAPFIGLLGCLEKAERHRAQLKASLFQWLFSGWSLLGGSWFQDWPSVPERCRALAAENTKLLAEAPVKPPAGS